MRSDLIGGSFDDFDDDRSGVSDTIGAGGAIGEGEFNAANRFSRGPGAARNTALRAVGSTSIGARTLAPLTSSISTTASARGVGSNGSPTTRLAMAIISPGGRLFGTRQNTGVRSSPIRARSLGAWSRSSCAVKSTRRLKISSSKACARAMVKSVTGRSGGPSITRSKSLSGPV